MIGGIWKPGIFTIDGESNGAVFVGILGGKFGGSILLRNNATSLWAFDRLLDNLFS